MGHHQGVILFCLVDKEYVLMIEKYIHLSGILIIKFSLTGDIFLTFSFSDSSTNAARSARTL